MNLLTFVNIRMMISGLYLEVKLFYLIKKGLQKCGLYLPGDLYSEVAFNTDLTVIQIAALSRKRVQSRLCGDFPLI